MKKKLKTAIGSVVLVAMLSACGASQQGSDESKTQYGYGQTESTFKVQEVSDYDKLINNIQGYWAYEGDYGYYNCVCFKDNQVSYGSTAPHGGIRPSEIAEVTRNTDGTFDVLVYYPEIEMYDEIEPAMEEHKMFSSNDNFTNSLIIKSDGYTTEYFYAGETYEEFERKCEEKANNKQENYISNNSKFRFKYINKRFNDINNGNFNSTAYNRLETVGLVCGDCDSKYCNDTQTWLSVKNGEIIAAFRIFDYAPQYGELTRINELTVMSDVDLDSNQPKILDISNSEKIKWYVWETEHEALCLQVYEVTSDWKRNIVVRYVEYKKDLFSNFIPSNG